MNPPSQIDHLNILVTRFQVFTVGSPLTVDMTQLDVLIGSILQFPLQSQIS